jgi:hypothetical protein
VTVVERPDLQRILDEQDLSMSKRIDPQARAAAGELRGVDALIVGQILSARVTTENKREGYGESTYQDGYRPEPNPDHVHAAGELDAAIQELERARQRLAEAEARLARYGHVNPDDPGEVAAKRKAEADVDEAKLRLAHAATNVGAARMQLAAIPPEVLVPNMVQHRYPIETFTKTARITAMLKMLDAATGEVLVAERLEGQYAESDRVIAGNPARNVPEDPLTLPDDALTLERASDPAITRLRQVLDQACAKRGYRFLVRMQRTEAAGDVELAADSAVRYLFAYPNGDDQTARMLDFLRKYLGDEDSLIDLRQLLRTHCRVLLN